MRERGLKLVMELAHLQASLSLPMRERGLKHVKGPGVRAVIRVAPHAGAWIETRCWLDTWQLKQVAPHAGAWIETGNSGEFAVGRKSSLPMRERGLKQDLLVPMGMAAGRSPCGSVD